VDIFFVQEAVMKPFRKYTALAVDGGGIRGVVVTRALAMLETALGKNLHDIFRLAVGTSTGAIISAGVGAGISARDMYGYYCEFGEKVFAKTWLTRLWPLTGCRYSDKALKATLVERFGNLKMGDFWTGKLRTDVVITTFDLETNHTLFIKPWKEEYKDWDVATAVQASCTVPTYFPVVQGRYIDGGVGSYSNPCYLAAYEAVKCLGWPPAETTLISVGTGRSPHSWSPGQVLKMWAWDWLNPMVDAFLQSADDQQVHLVETFFEELDFRRFQVDMAVPVEMDDPSDIPGLSAYGKKLGQMILNDQVDKNSMGKSASRAQ
jgi:uncharacterized protein